MTTTSPWTPEPGSPAAILERAEPAYKAMMMALCLASRADESLAPLSVAMAAVDLAGDTMLASGALWQAPDFAQALRRFADYLEARRADEPARPLLRMREVFASARPPVAN